MTPLTNYALSPRWVFLPSQWKFTTRSHPGKVLKIWHFTRWVKQSPLRYWDRVCKKGVLRNFTKFKGKHLCQSLFINKNAGLRPAILLKKRLWHRCFPVNFAKFLKTSFLQNTSGRLLLHHYNWTSKCRLRNTCLGFIKTQ